MEVTKSIPVYSLMATSSQHIVEKYLVTVGLFPRIVWFRLI